MNICCEDDSSVAGDIDIKLEHMKMATLHSLSVLSAVIILFTTIVVLCEAKHPEKIVAFFQGKFT